MNFKKIHLLGPTPIISLEIFVDLGLSDTEIARYFGIEEHSVSRLRRTWNIQGCC